MDSSSPHQLPARKPPLGRRSVSAPPSAGSGAAGGGSRWGRLVATVVVTVGAVTPGLMVPALAAPVPGAPPLSATAYGAAVTCFFACTAAGAPLARRIVPRMPVRAVLGAVGLLTVGVFAGLAVAGRAWQLCLLLALAGLGNAFTQPVAARVIAADIAPGRHSFAGGLFGASLGAGPFLPGLLVTLVGAPYGWRPALWTAAGLALLTLVAAALARPAADGRAVPEQGRAVTAAGPRRPSPPPRRAPWAGSWSPGAPPRPWRPSATTSAPRTSSRSVPPPGSPRRPPGRSRWSPACWASRCASPRAAWRTGRRTGSRGPSP
ncbi:MFS transporter [Streptomyces noursei]|uniref:MFS transporter n=1 Tax=Streptomyces noursei TaxID=1971 RepID=UPI000AC51B4C|nr:MFS transporter [Streptomyces noursei]